MSETILAIDPGLATGWSVWTDRGEGPAARLRYGLERGGSNGLRGSWIDRAIRYRLVDRVVCESFELDRRTEVPDITPKQIEGILIAWCWESGLPLTFQPKSHKALAGRQPKRRDQRLKDSGLWITGKEFDHEDGRDVNDSQLHALAYFFSAGHKPTIRHYWPDTDD